MYNRKTLFDYWPYIFAGAVVIGVLIGYIGGEWSARKETAIFYHAHK